MYCLCPPNPIKTAMVRYHWIVTKSRNIRVILKFEVATIPPYTLKTDRQAGRQGGAHDLMVIVIRYRHCDTSSNPRRGCLHSHSVSIHWNDMHPTILLPDMEK